MSFVVILYEADTGYDTDRWRVVRILENDDIIECNHLSGNWYVSEHTFQVSIFML